MFILCGCFFFHNCTLEVLGNSGYVNSQLYGGSEVQGQEVRVCAATILLANRGKLAMTGNSNKR